MGPVRPGGLFSQWQSQDEQLWLIWGIRELRKNRLRQEQGGSRLLPHFQRSVVACVGQRRAKPWRKGCVATQ